MEELIRKIENYIKEWGAGKDAGRLQHHQTIGMETILLLVKQHQRRKQVILKDDVRFVIKQIVYGNKSLTIEETDKLKCVVSLLNEIITNPTKENKFCYELNETITGRIDSTKENISNKTNTEIKVEGRIEIIKGMHEGIKGTVLEVMPGLEGKVLKAKLDNGNIVCFYQSEIKIIN